eukprot:5757640-Pyramimonas_sp.AAC.1
MPTRSVSFRSCRKRLTRHCALQVHLLTGGLISDPRIWGLLIMNVNIFSTFADLLPTEGVDARRLLFEQAGATMVQETHLIVRE